MTEKWEKWGQIYVCHEQRPQVFGTVLKMGVWPPEACLQGLASNRPVLLHPKGVVVSDLGKGAREGRQVSTGKMSASEPLMTHRQSLKQLSKLRAINSLRISLEATCLLSRWQPV